MTPEWDEKAVFLAALDLAVEQREAYLQRICPDQATLERLRALLRRNAEHTLHLPAQSHAAAPADPRQIDEFRILRRLGAGGMGVVYLAEDTILGRQVALKVLAHHLTDSEPFIARFREEARNAASLRHPGIVPVFKFGFDGAYHYIASEYVEGQTLSAAIQQECNRRRDSSDTAAIRAWQRHAAQLVAAIAEALDYSHKAGIVHRDVKPSNILVQIDGLPRLTDFGIAQHTSDHTGTQASDMLGSCYYMSPEQAAVAEVRLDHRSDVFSLGVVLYELLALHRPFEGRDAHQILRAVVSEPAPRIRTFDRLIPRDLETICGKAMEKERTNRYQTAAHMAADLRCFLAGDPILASPPSLLRRTRRWMRTHRLVVSLSACTLLAAGAVISFSMWRSARAQTLCWLTINAPTGDCLMYLQKVDPQTLQLAPLALDLPSAPGEVSLHPGSYRITVTAPDHSWISECDLPLYHTGGQSRIALSIGSAWNETPGDFNPLQPPAAPIQLSARDILTTTVATDQDMVLVPAGDYKFGWVAAPAGVPTVLTREQTVALPAFYIDRREVSNREYKQFIDATLHVSPWSRTGQPYDNDLADRPVVNITLADAQAYARWRGKRLPTMYEWQAAARTALGNRYPWGNDSSGLSLLPSPTPADLQALRQTDGERQFAAYKRCTVPVQSGVQSPLGLFHIFDNASELTSTIDYANRDVVWIRSWLDQPSPDLDLRKVESFKLDGYRIMLGFRCARSAGPPARAHDQR